MSITAVLADRPIVGTDGSISMITKGGLNSAIQNLAARVRAGMAFASGVAPGVVNTLMHPDDPTESTSHPTMKKATVLWTHFFTWYEQIM